MDHSLFDTMRSLGCRHPTDLINDPMLRAKMNSVAVYYKGQKVNIKAEPDDSCYRFIYASIETGWVIRTVNTSVLRALMIRTIDQCKLLGKPYIIDYDVPISDVEPDMNAKHSSNHSTLENASEVILVATACLITGGILLSRGFKEWSAYKAKK